ncbi:uncharacterized protein si:ch211-119e14.1 [Conger conger]|nr:uncharacterized protein si:ch211-119e14.1 [Conger conger]XP_061108389.1 uncharacterized protein si:ch211-119e14.1 [Conger conger]
MKSSTAQPLHASYLPLLCLLTLHIVTGNYIMASTTDMEAYTGSKDATGFPDAREGVYSLSRKFIREIPGKEDTPVRRKRSASSSTNVPYTPPVGLIVFLVILLVVIILALVFFYRRLNQETDGQYAPAKLLNAAMEWARNTGRAIDSRRRVLLRGHTSEDEEMGRQDDDDEEEEEEREEEECREKESMHEGESLAEDEQGEEDSSDDYSSLEGFCPGDGAMLKGKKGKRASQEKKEEKKTEVMDEKKEKEKEEEKKEGDEGRQAGEGLLADLKEFSGNAIWAEEKTNEVDTNKCDLTEL